MNSHDEMSLLRICDSSDFVKFLHACVDGLLGKKCEFVNSHSNDIEFTEAEFHRSCTVIQNAFKKKTQNPHMKFEETLPNLSDKSLSAIQSCFDIRKEEIVQFLARENLISMGFPLVENIDWKLKWILGSSKLISISEPAVQVDLNCTEGKNKAHKTVNFEMNLERLDKFIVELETIKEQLK